MLTRLIQSHPDVLAGGLIVLVAASLRVLFHPNVPALFESHAREYLVGAFEIMSGEGYSRLKVAPGYSLFIAAVVTLSRPSVDPIIIAQHVLGVGTALVAYGCEKTIAGRPAGLVAGLATAASGSALLYEHFILTETLFTLLLICSVWLAALGLKQRRFAWFVAAGFATGIATVVRPIGPALTPPVTLLALWLMRWRPGLVASIWYIVPLGLVLAPLALLKPTDPESKPVPPGYFLIMRTLQRNPTGVSMYGGPDRPDDPPLLRAGRRVIRDIEPEKPNPYDVVNALSRRLNLTEERATELRWQLALDAVRRRPDLFVAGTVLQVSQLIAGEEESVEERIARHSAWRGDALLRLVREGKLEPPPDMPSSEGSRRADLVARVYQPSSWMALVLSGCLFALFWAVRDPSRRLILLPLGALVVFIVGSVAAAGYQPRYRYPLDPLFHLGAAAGLAWTIQALVRTRLRLPSSGLRGPRPAQTDWDLG